MPRTECRDCGGPREPNSNYASYCGECGRRRQRDRYAEMRGAIGHKVNPRHHHSLANSHTSLTLRQERVANGQGRSGACEACGEYVTVPTHGPDGAPLSPVPKFGEPPLGLVAIRKGDRTLEEDLYGGGELWALWCRSCYTLSQQLDYQQLVRAQRILNYLQRQQPPLTLDDILPDMHDVMFPNPSIARTKSPQIDLHQVEQKAPK